MSTQDASSRQKRKSATVRWVVLALGAAALLILFPPFKIVDLQANRSSAGTAAGPGAFDAGAFADTFWSERLIPHLDKAAALEEVLPALTDDPSEAVELYGTKVGLGSTAYYFVHGEGEIVGVENSRALVAVDGEQIAIRLGPVFGNTVRDGTGLLRINDVPGLEEFNAVSAALNQKVEQVVIAQAREVCQVGARISFSGCASAPESLGEGPALTLVPLRVEVAD